MPTINNKLYYGHTIREWSQEIAGRIVDEWKYVNMDPEHSKLLQEVLAASLANTPEQTVRLIGTTVIESSYFDEPEELTMKEKQVEIRD